MKTLSLKISEQRYAEITAAARRRKISRAQVLRELIETNVETHRDGHTSLWDRMAHLILKPDDGPVDLSTTRLHMDDYGKNRADRRRSPRRSA